MRERILKWSARTETVLVLVIAFGTAVPRGLYTLVFPARVFGHGAPPINGPQLLRTLAYEIAVGAVLAGFLHTRGWSWKRLGLEPRWRDPLWALALLFVTYTAYYLLSLVVVTVWPGFYQLAVNTRLVATHIGWPILVAISIINPIFEEVFLCGYVVAALKDKAGAAVAVNVSAGIRLLCHLYQGPVGVTSLVPEGLVFATWFARTGRLWPLIVAHALQDLLGLLYGR
jgi:membrane protease YdiL (CAAX protease family)